MISLQQKIYGIQPPKGWALNKLAYVLRPKKGNKNTGMKESNLLSLSYGQIITKNIDATDGLLPESFEGYQIVEPGNIVIRLTDLQNDKRSIRQGLVRVRGIITSAYDALEVVDGNDPRYWSYMLLSLDLAKYYYSLGGGVRQSIKFSDFPNDWIAVPDLASQQEIGVFLDREVGRIDQLIHKKLKFSEMLMSKRAIVAQDVLNGCGAPPPNGTPETYNTGFFGSDWSVRKVKHTVAFMTSGSRGWSDLLSDVGELFIQSGNIGRFMEVNLINAPRIEPQVGAEANRTRLKSQDVLVCITGGRTGAVGLVGKINENAYVNQHICLLRARSEVLMPQLLAHFLYSEIGQRQLNFFQYGMKQGLGFSQVGEVKLPVPPREQQDKVLSKIENELSKIDKLSNNISRSIDKLREFRASFITSAVTGQIDIATWQQKGMADARLDAIQAGKVV